MVTETPGRAKKRSTIGARLDALAFRDIHPALKAVFWASGNWIRRHNFNDFWFLLGSFRGGCGRHIGNGSDGSGGGHFHGDGRRRERDLKSLLAIGAVQFLPGHLNRRFQRVLTP